MAGVFFGGSSEHGLSQLGNLGSPMRVDWFHTGSSMDVDMVSEVSAEANGANTISHTSSSSGPGVKNGCRNVNFSSVTTSINADCIKPFSEPGGDRPLTQSQYCFMSPSQRTSLRTASGPPASSDSIILPVVSLHASEDSRMVF